MMGIHMAAVAKLMSISSQSGAAPMVGALVFPFVLKLSYSMTLVRKTYCDLAHASRLFFFQLSHIVFNHADEDDEDDAHHHHNSRFERALRLVYERITQLRRSQTRSRALPMSSHDEDSLHTLSMLALYLM